VSRLDQFALSSRLLHWLMAALLLAMLFVGVSMLTSLGDYHRLLALHRPLGIALLVLAVARVVNRRLKPPPDFLPTMPEWERRVVVWSERLLYALMFAQPLVGWGLLSAGGYPVVLAGALVLPPIFPHSTTAYTLLRAAHGVLGYAFFATFLAHLAGVLFHTLVLRDGLILRMVPWRAKPAAEAREGASRTGT
jgi:cytochrome b561